MRLFKRVNFFVLLAVLSFPSVRAAEPFNLGPVDTGEVVAELVSEVKGIYPGQRFDVALRLKMLPHWHVYWINPGDTGLAPQVEWQLPEGFEVGALRFPVPHRIPTPPLVSYGYEGELFLLASVKAPEDLAVGSRSTLRAAANWLVCEDTCIPGDARLALELPVVENASGVEPAAYAEDISRTRAGLPLPAEGGVIGAEVLEDLVVLTLEWEGFRGGELVDPYFYVEEESVADSAGEQSFELSGTTLRVAIPKTEYFDEGIEAYSGLLYSKNGFDAAGGVSAVRFSESAAAAAGFAGEAGDGVGVLAIGFGQALLYAFLGGLILNLMPCVFPVLSIKALGFVQQAGEDRGKTLRHGVAFAVGVLVSFWILAGTLIALRAAGQSLGWGFQLQQPEFVIGLLVVMFLFGLSLAGVFEMGTSAIGLAGKVKSEGYTGSFFSGVLATAVATPCTGPFMGQALGFALTLSAFQSLTVFTLLALGMATPYLVLSANPKLIDLLPRPGAWMETFKQAMAFPMFATCIWLVWVLGSHVGNDGLLWVLGGLLVLAIGAWIYGRWSTPARGALARRTATALAAFFCLAGIWIMLPKSAAADDGVKLVWQEYSPELVAKLGSEGRPVFVDFTADWCLTCKANEARVFTSEAVLRRIAELDVQLVKADWTKRDPVITKALESFGRSGVPLYLLYDGKEGAAPRVLPQLLNPDLVLEELAAVVANESLAVSR